MLQQMTFKTQGKQTNKKKNATNRLSYRTVFLFKDNAAQLNGFIINSSPHCLPRSKVSFFFFNDCSVLRKQRTRSSQTAGTFTQYVMKMSTNWGSDKMCDCSTGVFVWHLTNRVLDLGELLSVAFFPHSSLTITTKLFRNWSVLFANYMLLL